MAEEEKFCKCGHHRDFHVFKDGNIIVCELCDCRYEMGVVDE